MGKRGERRLRSRPSRQGIALWKGVALSRNRYRSKSVWPLRRPGVCTLGREVPSQVLRTNSSCERPGKQKQPLILMSGSTLRDCDRRNEGPRPWNRNRRAEIAEACVRRQEVIAKSVSILAEPKPDSFLGRSSSPFPRRMKSWRPLSTPTTRSSSAPARVALSPCRFDCSMRPQKITFGDMREMGVRGVLIYLRPFSRSQRRPLGR